MTAPEVSVVMGVRNGGAELAATLDSILAQERVALELVVVDDGSDDGTAELLAARARQDLRVRVARQAHAGLTAALRRGCELARAPVIARHDAADRSQPLRLRRQLDVLAAHPEIALVSCRTLCEGPAGEPLYEQGSGTPADRAVAVLAGDSRHRVVAGPTAHGSVAFRAADYRAAGGYRVEFRLGQDWDLWFRLGEIGRFWLVGETLYAHRIRLDSLSYVFRGPQMRIARATDEALALRRAGRDEQPALARAAALSARVGAPTARERRRGRAHAAYHVGEALRRRGDRAAAGYLRAAALADPLLLRAWVRWLQAVAVRRRARGER